MTKGQIALATLGGLMLLPGLCGALFAGGTAGEHLSRSEWTFIDYEEAIWVIAQPSLMFGCLGVFVLAMSTRKPGLVAAAFYAAWFAFAATVAISALVIYAGSLRSTTGTWEGVQMSVWFGFCFLLGGLPGLLVRRLAGRENLQ